jgi:hypothetical protein
MIIFSCLIWVKISVYYLAFELILSRPVAENLHQRSFLGLNLCAHTYTDPEIDLVVAAFRKVWAHLEAGT